MVGALRKWGSWNPCQLMVTEQKVSQVLPKLLNFQVKPEICVAMSNLSIFRY